MNKEQIIEAMSCMDPTLVEAADRSASGRARSRWKRPVIAAACLCALLAGTAVAAELSGVRVVDFFNHEARSANPGWEPEIFSGYTVESDVAYFPIDALSPEIAELDRTAEQPVGRSFPSWEALETFVGLDIMENTALEGAPAGAGVDLGIEGGSGAYVVCVNAYPGEGVPRVLVNGSFLLHAKRTYYGWRNGVSVNVGAEVFTERQSSWGAGESSVYYTNDAEVSSEEYTAPSGLAVQLFRAYTPEFDTIATDTQTGEESPYTMPPWVRYDARFVLKGIPFQVSVSGELEREPLLRETILEVLDGFVCQSAA